MSKYETPGAGDRAFPIGRGHPDDLVSTDGLLVKFAVKELGDRPSMTVPSICAALCSSVPLTEASQAQQQIRHALKCTATGCAQGQLPTQFVELIKHG